LRPAFSVIFLTTLTGAGQGLFLALYAAELGARAGVIDAPDARFFLVGGLLAAGLASLGLAASFFHLGHPERAWRSAAMWRTSWLSREVIALPLFIAGAALYGFAHHFSWPGLGLLGLLALAACLALFVCTAMIYMCLKFLQEWASPLTLVNFVLLGCASGLTLAAPLSSALAPQLADAFAASALLLTLAALVSRVLSLYRNARLRPKSTMQSAIGVRGRVVQRSQGFTAGSFNTREFFHGASPAKLKAVKWGFLVLGFAAPAALLAAALLLREPALLVAAFLLQYPGLVAERWYFFAQANHPQNLYYQVIS
jgi:DMSO reductase anchor subunit